MDTLKDGLETSIQPTGSCAEILFVKSSFVVLIFFGVLLTPKENVEERDIKRRSFHRTPKFVKTLPVGGGRGRGHADAKKFFSCRHYLLD